MDKMYNNLMDIVNRTKTINGGKTTIKKVENIKPVDSENGPVDESVHVVQPAPKKSLAGEGSAIGKLLNSAKAKKEASKKTAEKSKTTKKSTTKSTSAKKKSTTTKKTTTKTPKEAPKKEVEKKPVEKEAPKLDFNDPKNVELYNALKTSLFAEGTDISKYIDEEQSQEQKPKIEKRNILKELQAKKEANKENKRINEEISKEQQEYEALFTGGFGYEEQEEEVVEDKEEIEQLQEFLRPKIHKEEKPVHKVDVGYIDSEVEQKIADYYKQKNEKIAEYMKEELSDEEDDEKVDSYTDRQREYESLFNTPSDYNPFASLAENAEKVDEEDDGSDDEVINEETLEDNEVTEENVDNDNIAMEEQDVPENLDESIVSSFELMEREEGSEEDEEDVEELSDDTAEEINENSEVEELSEEDDDDEEVYKPFLFLKRDRDEKELAEKENDYSLYDDEELDRYPVVSKKKEMVRVDDDVIGEETLNEEDDFEELSDEEEDLIFLNKLKSDDDSDAYENELAKYIISDNLNEEEKVEEDEPVDNNTIILDNLDYNRTETVEEEKEDSVEDEDEDNSISKEEFYNEMARLQENLISELKGNKGEAGVDLFEKEKEETPVVVQVVQVQEEKKELTPEEKAEAIVEKVISSITKEEALHKIVDGVVEENHKYDDYNLLGKDAPLGEDDLEYIRKNKEKEKELKDKYFYLSAEDNEKKAEIEDAYMEMYNDEVSGNVNKVEMGDINLNKDINNPVPYVYDYMEEENTIEVSDEDMEAIYTLFGVEKKKVTKMEKEMKILYVAGECQPFIATGGLADVAGSVTKAMAKADNIDCRVIMPLYAQIKENYRDELEYIGNFTVHLSWRQEYCGLFRYYKDGVTFYFIDNERYFKREKTYGYYDDGERFAYFCKAIVESLPILNFFPDIIHCNDWQSALVSVYIKTGNWSDHRYYKIKHVYTIHNIEYQGVFGMENLKDLFGIDYRFKNDMEYNGDINLSKAAIMYADKFTTVSQSYCDNLKEPYCSRGLHHVIIRNEHKLSGIINGIDYSFYHPSIDKALFKNYSIDTLEDKVMNKKIWQDELGLPVDGDTPMLAIVSRLVSLKGLGIVTKIIEDVLQQDVQLVVVGTGDQKYVDYFKYLEEKYPTKVRALVDKYSNDFARKAYAASDIFLMPSKVEPCGISQMISSIYGSVPIVRETGGLKDTIRDFGCVGGGNGYTFASYNQNDLLFQINRALKDYADKENWREKMKTCMSVDFSWDKPVQKYIDLYKSLVE